MQTTPPSSGAAGPTASARTDADAPGADEFDLTPAARDALDGLLSRIRSRPDFPALSKAIARLGELTRSDDERIDRLVDAIVSDVALTARVLRLANCSLYRTAGQAPITTIAHAVMLLGIEAVRSLALSVTLYEQLADAHSAARLRAEYVRALLAGALARALADPLGVEANEAWLCGLFNRLGQIVVFSHLPDEVEDIAHTVRRRRIPEDLAVRMVLGIGYDQVGTIVAREWGFPHAVIAGMRGPSPGEPVPQAISHETRLHVLASLCSEIIDAFIDGADTEGRDPAFERLGRRYAPATRIGAAAMRDALVGSIEEVLTIADAVGLDLGTVALGRRMLSLDVPDDSTADLSYPAAPAHSPPSPTRQAQETLAIGLADMSRALADEQPLADVVRLAVEVLQQALGLQRVIFALRDAGADALVGRFGVGEGLPGLLQVFRIPIVQTGDLFSATAVKGADLLISDARADNVARHLPAWHARFDAGSFLILPLTVRTGTVALLYGDRPQALDATPAAQVQSLVRAIRNQLVLALQRGR